MAERTFSTDPGWYVDSLPEGVPTMTLRQIHANATEAYNRAGGHNFARQMQRVMMRVENEMGARGLSLDKAVHADVPVDALLGNHPGSKRSK